jgi:hypothetical protein
MVNLSEYTIKLGEAHIAELEKRKAIEIFNRFENGNIDLASYLIAMVESGINKLARDTIEAVLRKLLV